MRGHGKCGRSLPRFPVNFHQQSKPSRQRIHQQATEHSPIPASQPAVSRLVGQQAAACLNNNPA
jgi:hypothetical protein